MCDFFGNLSISHSYFLSQAYRNSQNRTLLQIFRGKRESLYLSDDTKKTYGRWIFFSSVCVWKILRLFTQQNALSGT